ncbi:MAG: methyltransferase domain-containing protein [Gammaproteobacteria bacterium]
MTDSYIEWKDWRAEDFGRFDAETAAYFAQELEASGVASVRDLTVGELGYGNGAFAGWVRRAGGRWVGREAIPELQQRAAGAGFAVIAPEVAFSEASDHGPLDLLVVFDVIEHLELAEIRAFLRDATRALRPGGLLLIRIPSGDSPFSHAIYTGDLTHRSLLGSSAVRRLAEEAGLDVSQIRSPVFPVTGSGARGALRRMSVLSARAIVFKFIRTVLMGNSGAIISPNMLVVFRRPAC